MTPTVQFDCERRIWVAHRYTDVLAALRDRRLSAGCVSPQFRENAAAALASIRLPDVDPFGSVSGEIDLIGEVARPWSLRLATMVTGTAGDALNGLASDIFLSAQHPFDAELRLRSEQATIELASQFEGPLQSFWVQAFVALSQSLPAFLGNAWLALLRQPAAIISLKIAVEELLRYAGPSIAQFRTATEDIEFAHLTIPKGDRVALMLAAANRDPEVFVDPDRLNLQRHPNPHLAFGAGDHTCIGAALIRRAALAALASFATYFRTAQLVGYELSEGFAIRSVASLRVRL